MNSKKVFKYLGITFAITWAAFLIRAILCNMNVIEAYSIAGTLLFGLAVIGPTIAAYICLDDRSPKGFFRMLSKRKKGTIMYLIVLAILYALTFYISTFKLKDTTPIYMIPFVFIEMIFFGGCNEEVGWFGTLYPELEKKFKDPIATAISLGIWFVWHLPMFITNGDTHQGTSLLTFFLFLLTMALLKTALWRRTESVLYIGIIHALANTYETMFAYDSNTIMVVATVILWIISVILWYFPKDKDKSDENQDKVIEKQEEDTVITPIINPEQPAAAIEATNENVAQGII